MYYVPPVTRFEFLPCGTRSVVFARPAVPFHLWLPSGARIHSVLLYSEGIRGGKQGNDAAAGAGAAETP